MSLCMCEEEIQGGRGNETAINLDLAKDMAHIVELHSYRTSTILNPYQARVKLGNLPLQIQTHGVK